MPLDELTTAAARPAEVVGDFEVDESWQPGDPLPEYFDESGFPIDPSVVAAMLAERSAASDDAVAGLPTTPLTVGSTIFVDLPEHGISADFTVREIRPCPTPIVGDGYLVTTKFIHANAEILDLRIEGSDEPIGTTSSHPFWSEDRQQFIAAGELRVGENLILADETTRRVESITLRSTRETVYNIEVDGEHVFYVGEDGVLVHNTCPNPWGRRGCPAHVAKILQAESRLTGSGIWKTIAGGSLKERLFGRRFPDLVIENAAGQKIAIQVGKRNLFNRLPISRESRALQYLRGLRDANGNRVFEHVFFIEY
jgi:ribosomal protein L31